MPHLQMQFLKSGVETPDTPRIDAYVLQNWCILQSNIIMLLLMPYFAIRNKSMSLWYWYF